MVKICIIGASAKMDEVVCAHLFFLGKRGEADFASDCKTIWEEKKHRK